MEKSRTQIDLENEGSRESIHSEDVSQIKALSEKLDDHCNQNKKTDKETSDKLDKLMPLTDLIPTLQEIVDIKKNDTYLSKRISRFISVGAGVVAIIAGFFTALYYAIKISTGR